MAGKDTSYTLAHWRIAMGEIVVALGDQIGPALEHVRADWAAMGAGRTQMAFGLQAITRTYQQAEKGKELFGGNYVRLAQVSQGQAAAGGLDEVAERKEYHTRQG